jgi:hypothetical protein
MELINGILFFVLLGLQTITILPSKITKIRWQLFIPLVSLLLYIWYESYYLRPEVLEGVPIRVDLLVLHPLIVAAFILSLIRSIFMWKNKRIMGGIAFIAILSSFIYWWYHILVVCQFYQ